MKVKVKSKQESPPISLHIRKRHHTKAHWTLVPRKARTSTLSPKRPTGKHWSQKSSNSSKSKCTIEWQSPHTATKSARPYFASKINQQKQVQSSTRANARSFYTAVSISLNNTFVLVCMVCETPSDIGEKWELSVVYKWPSTTIGHQQHLWTFGWAYGWLSEPLVLGGTVEWRHSRPGVRAQVVTYWQLRG